MHNISIYTFYLNYKTIYKKQIKALGTIIALCILSNILKTH